jgi:hypothetical protein
MALRFYPAEPAYYPNQDIHHLAGLPFSVRPRLDELYVVQEY